MPSGRLREYNRGGWRPRPDLASVYDQNLWRAYQGPNGWYVARTLPDGSHVAPIGGGQHSSEGNAWRAWRKATGAGKLRG